MKQLVGVFILCFSQLMASDWLMIQGTEPKTIMKDGVKINNSLSTPQLWGFAQVKYEKNYSDIVEAAGINKTAFAYVKPSLQKQSQLQLFRARLGLRGVLDDENKINYFLLTDFGENGISNPAGHRQHTYLTDASMTLRHIPYANIRFGMFKYPGSEEGFQARFVSPFIIFTQMSEFLLLEKIPETNKADVNTNGTFVGRPDHSVSAYRDTGIEVFDRLKLKDDWTLSYALMIGNGSGIKWENRNSGHYTGYGYLALENSFGKGKGYYHEDFKTYVWYQEGKRRLNANNESNLYDRIRYGTGLRYFKDGLRLEAEYAGAEGMIFTGPKDADPTAGYENWHLSMEAGKNNRAYGYYLAAAYEVYPKIETMIRYDELNNMTNSVTKERIFKTTTLGLTYHFKGPTRVDLNYLIKDAKAPGSSAAQNILNNMGNAITLQYTYKFSVR